VDGNADEPGFDSLILPLAFVLAPGFVAATASCSTLNWLLPITSASVVNYVRKLRVQNPIAQSTGREQLVRVRACTRRSSTDRAGHQLLPGRAEWMASRLGHGIPAVPPIYRVLASSFRLRRFV
jgi:hypothetical protein